MNSLGHEDHNFINNIGSVFYLFITAFIIFLFVNIIKSKTYGSYYYMRFRKWFKYWNHVQNLLQILQQGYLELIMSSYLNQLHSLDTSIGDRFSYRLGNIFMVVSLIIYPVFLLYLLSFYRNELK